MVLSPRPPSASGGPRRGTPQFMVTQTRGVLTLHGELDLATAALLEEALCVGHPPYGDDLVVDLSGLTFCGCAGLSVLLTEHRRLPATGSKLILVAPTRGVRRVLALTGLDAVLDIRPTAPAAHRGAAGTRAGCEPAVGGRAAMPLSDGLVERRTGGPRRADREVIPLLKPHPERLVGTINDEHRSIG